MQKQEIIMIKNEQNDQCDPRYKVYKIGTLG